jgi:CMP-N,N'-diacetyllegionaminic acid synthase
MPDITPAEILTLIPARSGSKGLPGKNIRPFLGKPLIAHTINAARDSEVAGRIVVSTDDPDIARVAVDWGSEAPFLRPPSIASDESPVLAAALHAVDWFIRNESWEPRWLLLLQPTSPLRTADDIRHAFDLLAKTDADAVVSVSETKSHPHWVKSLTGEGFLRPFVEGQSAPPRRQDLPPAYALNGMIFLVRISTLREESAFCPRRSLPLVIPASRAFDIDTAHDFLIAEYAATLAAV